MYSHHHCHNFINFTDSVTLAYIRKDSPEDDANTLRHVRVLYENGRYC